MDRFNTKHQFYKRIMFQEMKNFQRNPKITFVRLWLAIVTFFISRIVGRISILTLPVSQQMLIKENLIKIHINIYEELWPERLFNFL